MDDSQRDGAADPPRIERPEGRDLAYAEYGAADGTPVFAFHGVLGSRLGWSLFDEAAREQGVRLLAPERPGFGHSGFQRGRDLLDWPADVTALADHLGVDRFGLVGFSGGGPHAVACAHALPDQVRGVSLAGTVTPPSTHDRGRAYQRAVLDASGSVPGFSATAFASASWLAKTSRPQFRASLVASAGTPDRALFDSPVGDRLVDDAAEGFRAGGRGPAHDLELVGDDWGFDPAVDIPVTLYHGRADATVDLEMARAFGDLLPAADLHIGEGAHYSTLLDNRAALLRAATDA